MSRNTSCLGDMLTEVFRSKVTLCVQLLRGRGSRKMGVLGGGVWGEGGGEGGKRTRRETEC